MITLRYTVVNALALVLAGGMAIAQNRGATPPEKDEGGKPPRPPIDTALDVNGDEIIDAGEIANAVAALRTLDRNGDGQLSPDEHRPPHPDHGAGGGGASGGDAGHQKQALPPAGAAPPQGKGAAGGSAPTGGRPLPPIVKALDANGDGVIAASELAGAVAALKMLDTNADGRLTPDEYRPPRPDGGRPPGSQALTPSGG